MTYASTGRTPGGRTPGTTAPGSSDRTPPGLVILLGGIAWILATLQFGIAQVVAASAWNPPYDWLANYISDLGNTACGQFAVPHGTPAYVCSPLYAVMNASFIVSGVLDIAGAILMRRIRPHRGLMTTALVLWVLSGLGKIMVGLFPENTNLALHLLGALNIPIGSIAILLFSLSILRSNRAIGIFGLACAIAGLVGTVLSTAAPFAGPSLYLGLGVGGMERVSDYPAVLWVLVIGILAVLSVGNRGSRRSVSLW